MKNANGGCRPMKLVYDILYMMSVGLNPTSDIVCLTPTLFN